MKSKIIKVSIILIFMMFSAGLFNFCFALEYTNFIEGGGIPLKSVETDNAGNSISTLKMLYYYQNIMNLVLII